MFKRHAIIVGGGVSGLATAVELRRLAHREGVPLKMTLIESRDRLGGVLRTYQQSSFVVEAAADALDAGGCRGDATTEFLGSLGLSDQLAEASASFRRFFVLQNKKMILVPNIFTSFNLADLCRSPLLNIFAKIRLLGEPFVAPRKQTGDEGLGSFVRRRLGEAFYRSMLEPVVRGIYMADPETLSLETLFPRLRRWEHDYGSLGRALWAERSWENKNLYLGFRRGFEALVQAMIHELKEGCEIRTGCAVRCLKINETGKTVVLDRGEVMQADILCLAMSVPEMVPVLKEGNAELARGLEGIRHESLLTACWVFKAGDFPEGVGPGGFLVPGAGDRYPFSSLKWFDAISGEGYRCLRVFISESISPEIFCESDTVLQEKILKIVCPLMGIGGTPEFTIIQRYPKALPLYEVGHVPKIGRIHEILQKYPGLFLTGNSFSGFGVPECICAARATARQMLLHPCTPPSGPFGP